MEPREQTGGQIDCVTLSPAALPKQDDSLVGEKEEGEFDVAESDEPDTPRESQIGDELRVNFADASNPHKTMIAKSSGEQQQIPNPPFPHSQHMKDMTPLRVVVWNVHSQAELITMVKKRFRKPSVQNLVKAKVIEKLLVADDIPILYIRHHRCEKRPVEWPAVPKYTRYVAAPKDTGIEGLSAVLYVRKPLVITQLREVLAVKSRKLGSIYWCAGTFICGNFVLGPARPLHKSTFGLKPLWDGHKSKQSPMVIVLDHPHISVTVKSSPNRVSASAAEVMTTSPALVPSRRGSFEPPYERGQARPPCGKEPVASSVAEIREPNTSETPEESPLPSEHKPKPSITHDAPADIDYVRPKDSHPVVFNDALNPLFVNDYGGCITKPCDSQEAADVFVENNLAVVSPPIVIDAEDWEMFPLNDDLENHNDDNNDSQTPLPKVQDNLINIASSERGPALPTDGGISSPMPDSYNRAFDSPAFNSNSNVVFPLTPPATPEPESSPKVIDASDLLAATRTSVPHADTMGEVMFADVDLRPGTAVGSSGDLGPSAMATTTTKEGSININAQSPTSATGGALIYDRLCPSNSFNADLEISSATNNDDNNNPDRSVTAATTTTFEEATTHSKSPVPCPSSARTAPENCSSAAVLSSSGESSMATSIIELVATTPPESAASEPASPSQDLNISFELASSAEAPAASTSPEDVVISMESASPPPSPVEAPAESSTEGVGESLPPTLPASASSPNALAVPNAVEWDPPPLSASSPADEGVLGTLEAEVRKMTPQRLATLRKLLDEDVIETLRILINAAIKNPQRADAYPASLSSTEPRSSEEKSVQVDLQAESKTRFAVTFASPPSYSSPGPPPSENAPVTESDISKPHMNKRSGAITVPDGHQRAYLDVTRRVRIVAWGTRTQHHILNTILRRHQQRQRSEFLSNDEPPAPSSISIPILENFLRSEDISVLYIRHRGTTLPDVPEYPNLKGFRRYLATPDQTGLPLVTIVLYVRMPLYIVSAAFREAGYEDRSWKLPTRMFWSKRGAFRFGNVVLEPELAGTINSGDGCTRSRKEELRFGKQDGLGDGGSEVGWRVLWEECRTQKKKSGRGPPMVLDLDSLRDRESLMLHERHFVWGRLVV